MARAPHAHSRGTGRAGPQRRRASHSEPFASRNLRRSDPLALPASAYTCNRDSAARSELAVGRCDSPDCGRDVACSQEGQQPRRGGRPVLRRCHSKLRGESRCIDLADLERSPLFPVLEWTAGGWTAMKERPVRHRPLDGGVRTPVGARARPDRARRRTRSRSLRIPARTNTQSEGKRTLVQQCWLESTTSRSIQS